MNVLNEFYESVFKYPNFYLVSYRIRTAFFGHFLLKKIRKTRLFEKKNSELKVKLNWTELINRKVGTNQILKWIAFQSGVVFQSDRRKQLNLVSHLFWRKCDLKVTVVRDNWYDVVVCIIFSSLNWKLNRACDHFMKKLFIYCFKNIYMAFKSVINPTANWIIYRKSILSYRPLVIWIDYSLNKNQTVCAWDTPYYEHVKHTLFDFYLNQHSIRNPFKMKSRSQKGQYSSGPILYCGWNHWVLHYHFRSISF